MDLLGGAFAPYDTRMARLGVLVILALGTAAVAEVLPLSPQSCNTQCQDRFTECIDRCDAREACMSGCERVVEACVARCQAPEAPPAPSGSSSAAPTGTSAPTAPSADVQKPPAPRAKTPPPPKS